MNECSDFEREMWLYIEGSLPAERMKFWGDHFSGCGRCRELLEETKSFLSGYDKMPLDDLSGEKYEEMIKKAVRSKKILYGFRAAFNSFFSPSDSPGIQPFKIAFGSALAVAAILLLLLSEKPNPVKNITNDLLDWEGTKIEAQMSEIENSMILIKDEELKNYIIQNIADQNWNGAVYSIDRRIEIIKKEIDDSSL